MFGRKQLEAKILELVTDKATLMIEKARLEERLMAITNEKVLMAEYHANEVERLREENKRLLESALAPSNRLPGQGFAGMQSEGEPEEKDDVPVAAVHMGSLMEEFRAMHWDGTGDMPDGVERRPVEEKQDGQTTTT